MTAGRWARAPKKKVYDDSWENEVVAEPQSLPPQRGAVLHEAINTINGERQDVYGSPEDSFSIIADYWTTYLGDQMTDRITAGDVALMMTLFKIAREANQHKRDNIIDAAGYLGIYADMQGAE